MDKFGTRLKQFRKQKKLSQKNLATLIGITQTSIANYENDIRFPNQEILTKLADHLQVSIDELLGRILEPSHQVDKDTLVSIETFQQMAISGKDDETILAAIALAEHGKSVFDIYDNYVKPTMYEVGRLWEAGRLSIAQEHHITSTMERIVNVLIPYNNMQDLKVNLSVVLLTMNHEPHKLGLKMVNEVFKHYGWKTYFIGSTIPWYSIVELINDYSIKYVGISITMPNEENTVYEFIQHIRANTEAKIILGGQGIQSYPDLVKQLAPDYFSLTDKEFEVMIKKISN